MNGQQQAVPSSLRHVEDQHMEDKDAQQPQVDHQGAEDPKPAVLERPRTVIIAVALWVVSALLCFAIAILFLTQQGDIVQANVAGVQKASNISHDQAVSALNSYLYLLEILFFVFGALALGFLSALWTLRRWAKVALWILAVAEVLVVLFLFNNLLISIATLFGLVAVAMLSTPSANSYFAAIKAMKQSA